jgi:heat shock protein HslJ
MKALIIAALTLNACAGEPPMEPKSTLNLVGSEWGLAETESLFIPFTGSQFIAFKVDGKLSGHGGCNRFFASFEQDGEALSIGPIGSTKMLCPPETMDAERALFEALKNTASADISHLTLTLKDRNGAPILTLQRRDWD